MCKANSKRSRPRSTCDTYWYKRSDKIPDEICSEILRLIKELKTDKNKIVVSIIVWRGDAHNGKVEKVKLYLNISVKIMVLIRFHMIISM